MPVGVLPLFKWDWTGNRFGDSDRKALYTLEKIVEELNLNLVRLKDEINKEKVLHMSDHVAGKCVESICSDPNIKIDIDTEIKGISQFSPQKADVNVYSDQYRKVLASSYDVQSSPMEFTEKKAVLRAANLIRLLRNSDKDFSQVTVFTLPNLEEKSCIVEITVNWKQCRFFYKLTCHDQVKEGINRISEIFDLYSKKKGIPPIPASVSSHFIKLNSQECQLLCACGSISEQLSSPTHIVVECTTSVHKVLYEPTEWGAKLLVGLSAMHVIQPVEETQHRIQEIFFYKYSRVKYGPIKAEDARKCLKALV